MRRLAVMTAGAVASDSRGDPGTVFDGVLIEPLLGPHRFDCLAPPQTSLRCWACAPRQARRVAGVRHDRRAGCCARTLGARASAWAPVPLRAAPDSPSLPSSATRI